jgi:protoheme IX farnesyltransferase
VSLQNRDADGADVAVGGGVRDFIALLKPRVMSLVVFTGMVGLFLAPGTLHPVLAFTAILCIAIGAGAAGAINMWYDRDIDAVMSRTQNRPIPQGKVDASEALGFGVILAGASVLVMALGVNYAAGAMLALSIGFYVFIYTMWLKRRTPQNIVIGGAAGAFPPMIGWAAVTGSLSLTSVALFAIIFMWTPPHFWALSLFRSGDYAKAGVPMLPVVSGVAETKRQMLIYTLLLLPVTLVPVAMGDLGLGYASAAVILGFGFIIHAVLVLRDDGTVAAKRMFGFSLVHLASLFAAMVVDRLMDLPRFGLGGLL